MVLNVFLEICVQNKLVVALKEYRLLHSQQASQAPMQLPHNLLIYPSTLRLLPLLTLGTPCTLLLDIQPAVGALQGKHYFMHK